MNSGRHTVESQNSSFSSAAGKRDIKSGFFGEFILCQLSNIGRGGVHSRKAEKGGDLGKIPRLQIPIANSITQGGDQLGRQERKGVCVRNDLSHNRTEGRPRPQARQGLEKRQNLAGGPQDRGSRYRARKGASNSRRGERTLEKEGGAVLKRRLALTAGHDRSETGGYEKDRESLAVGSVGARRKGVVGARGEDSEVGISDEGKRKKAANKDFL